MEILIACEESQEVCKAFRAKGHEAYSCDLLPCSGGRPEWHMQGYLEDIIGSGADWDMIIAFPPCTYITVTGNRWFNVERYGEKAIQRQKDRRFAISFFMMIANRDCPKIVIENPVGVMSSEWRKPDQIINPYEFGDPFEKKTCLWLKGVPKLIPTNVVEPAPRKEFKSGKTMPSWYADAWKLPKEERAKLRSKTFPGIAEAMANQWGDEILL